MDANGIPNLPDDKVNQITTSAVDTRIELINTVLAIIKEVGEMLNSVPFVKSLSGVIIQIIKIRNEIKANKERCNEVIDKVLRMAKSIYEKLAEVMESNQREKLSKLEGHLNDHTSALIAVYEALEKNKSTRSRFSRLINRGLDELNAHDRRLDELNTELILNITFHITMEQVASAAISDQHAPSDIPSHILPPKPYLMVEREDQFNTALMVLLGAQPSRIAILGGGGFGKTTLARAILHDPQIPKHYESRYFLSCEAMPDVDSLLLGISNMLDIKATPSTILASIRRKLETSRTLLCLDNFETPWEPPATRTRIEDILAFIASIPHLSLVITIRGTQRPSKVDWSHPLLPPLPTLSSESARMILHKICQGYIVDDFTQRLLDDVDGIPLAITLISNLLRDGESSQDLWIRWSSEQTAAIENGGEGREASLNASIALSVNSPRTRKDPCCVSLLAALSLLPDGFPSASIEELEKHLGITGIRKHLQTLRAVALIKQQDITPSSRIQMLSPIRLFCNQFLSSEISLVFKLVCGYYVAMMRFAKDGESNPTIYPHIAPEIHNVHSIFQKVYTDGCQQDIESIIYCTATLTHWSTYIGYLNQDTIYMALERSTNHPIPRAACLSSLGTLCVYLGQYAKAEQCLREAAELYKFNSSPVGEAIALRDLGDLLTRVSHLDQAEIVLKASLELYTKSNHQAGQATVRELLGTLCIRQEHFSEAEANLTSALEVFSQRCDLLGIANTTQTLAPLYIELDDLEKSEKFAAESLAASKEANYALGEGTAFGYLGRIYLQQDRITDSRHALEQALAIFKRLNCPINQLNAIIDLSAVYIQSDQLSAAEALLTTSAKVELDVIEIPKILTMLGRVYISANHFDKAEYVLDHALLLFQKFGEKFGQADALVHLGIVYFKSSRLDDAEQILNFIPDLGIWCDIDMRRLWVLGDLYIVKEQLEAAEVCLDEAMEDAKDFKSSYQQGNILRSMGIFNIKQGHVDLALDKFHAALELHQRAQWVSEQATDLKRLGEAYEMSGRSEDATAAFEKAKELMGSVRETRKLAL